MAAKEPGIRKVYNISAGEAPETLRLFSEQSGEELLYSAEAIQGVKTNQVKGSLVTHVALELLLAQTHLRAQHNPRTGGYAITSQSGNKSRTTEAHSSKHSNRSADPHLDENPVKRSNPLTVFTTWLALALAPAAHPSDASSHSGSITGTVSNTATRNLLEGAKVELPQVGLTAVTDSTGRFVLTGVPPGTHQVVASYLGLDTLRSEVAIVSGQREVRHFDLTTGIYTLEAFKVTGEREGDAAAITAQRNADNVKNIIAMDSYGNLPNLNVAEVVMRLPGIAGSPTDEGVASQFTVRGSPAALNSVTVDGGLIPGTGIGRNFGLQNITATMYEQLELIKGHTPDKGADSIAGTLNLKTRSPLNLKEKRRITYNAAARVAPSFTEQIPLREAHRAHPLLTLGYQEVFGILGGERNLGVAVNLFYSENVVGSYRTIRDFQNTLEQPAYLWSYRTSEIYNNRKQASINVKTDYRYSFNTKFMLNLTAHNNFETFRRDYGTRMYTGNANAVPNATTSGIVPGFTDRITEVRPVSASTVDISTSGPNNFIVHTYQADFGGEHEYGALRADYNVGLSRNELKRGFGKAAFITHRLSNVGWIIDRTQSDLYPRIVQTAGPDMSNPANYRPTANGFDIRPNAENQEVGQFRGNVRYMLPMVTPVHFKAGLSWREQSGKLQNHSRRWSYLGATALPSDTTAVAFHSIKTGFVLPRWEATQFIRDDGEPVDPSLWREDNYYREQVRFTGNRGVSEAVTAGYVMAQGKLGHQGVLGRTGFLTGVRTEKTDTKSYGWVRARFPSTSAQQVADPVGSAARDYADTRRETKGSYTKSFPSAHVTHDVTENLKARLSWSTSFGRPAMSNLLPNESVSEANQTVTVNNPSLLPQMAKNWDATIDYYFQPVGNLSIGWFHKTINDYIVTGIDSGTVGSGSNNGYNGQYEGFRRLSTANAGTATVQGWEFSYQQQFTFLPGLLKGLSGNANYTIIDTHGDFGGTFNRRTGEVAGFIPRAANISLSWRYRSFSTRVLYNYTGDYLDSYSAVSPALNLYRYGRNTINLGLAYQLRPSLSFTCDINNIFNEKQRIYVGIPDRMQKTTLTFVTVSLGVSGRF